MRSHLSFWPRLAATAMLALLGAQAVAQEPAKVEPPKPDYPPSDKVLEGYEKVVTKANIKPMYTLWTRQKDGQMYAELPRGFAQKIDMALGVYRDIAAPFMGQQLVRMGNGFFAAFNCNIHGYTSTMPVDRGKATRLAPLQKTISTPKGKQA